MHRPPKAVFVLGAQALLSPACAQSLLSPKKRLTTVNIYSIVMVAISIRKLYEKLYTYKTSAANI